jgi:nitrogen fixation protein FixH
LQRQVEMTKEKTDREEAAKVRIFIWLMLMGVIMFTAVIAQHLNSDEMVHKFKSPSFSGIGTSAHYLTIENQQFNRKQALKAEIKALQDEIERDKENTTLARFIRNLESRIYAQLSRQLVENLFGETASDSGVLELEGNRIEYNVVDGIITLNITDSDGNTTTISLPIGSFTF